MSKTINKKWWKAAATRAIRTVAQAAVATIGASTLVTDVNWLAVASAALMAGALSLLTSVAGLPECRETDGGAVGDGDARGKSNKGC